MQINDEINDNSFISDDDTTYTNYQVHLGIIKYSSLLILCVYYKTLVL